MVLFFAFSIFLAFIYIFIISHLYITWNEIENWKTDEHFVPETKVSIVIPFRNEAQHIKACIESVLKNNYPKHLYEIIAVDDHSEDSSLEIAKEIQSKNLSFYALNAEFNGIAVSGKKEAIRFGVEKSTGSLVVTLDGDCIVGISWLRHIVSYYEYSHKSIIIGMVSVNGGNNILESFQVMDTCGTMGLHASGIHNHTHYLANGANLIFEKKLFEEINPFDKNIQFASGDDVFFVNKVSEQHPESIGFLKSLESTVETICLKDWKQMWSQRRRWASKTKAFSHGFYKWMTGIIWLLCISILINVLLIPFIGILALYIACIQLIVKGLMDYIYLRNICAYFNKSNSMRYYIPSMFVHIGYILFAGYVAIRGGEFEWKGRTRK